MEISAFHHDYVSEAAALFVQGYEKQRLKTPALPGLMADPGRVRSRLERLFATCPGVMAIDNDRLSGYMGWFLVDGFRGTNRKAAYVPEWGHACAAHAKARIYRAMYRAAAGQWAAANCRVHAISLLAHDGEAEKVWFWNGFGLTVVDAVRPMRPLDLPPVTDLQIRKATPDDAGALAELDAEHWRHYTQSPVFMAAHGARNAADQAAFLARPKNRVWLALDGDVLAGFLRYDGYDFDSVAIVESPEAVLVTGAYVRPAFRGRGAAAALLDSALRDYQALGFTSCAVNFESFNPEAVSFWAKYFEPVSFSLLRVPESLSPGSQPDEG